MLEEESSGAEPVCADTDSDSLTLQGGVRRKTRGLYGFLLKLADLIAERREVPDLFSELTPIIHHTTESDVLTFSVHDTARDCWMGQHWKSDGQKGVLHCPSTGIGIAQRVQVMQQPVVISGGTDELDFLSEWQELLTLGIRSYVALPMNTSQRRYGVLGFGSSQFKVPTREKLEFLSRVARITAMAFDTQRLTRDWHKEKERLERIATIGKDLTNSLDLDALMPIVFRHIRELTRYDYALLGLLEEEGNAIWIRSADLPAWDQPFQKRVPLEHATSLETIRTRAATIIDEDNLKQIGGPVADMLLQGGIQTVCNLPLLIADRVLGALNLGTREKHGFRQVDAGYLQEIANRIASALENARRFGEVAELKERLSQERPCLEAEPRASAKWENLVGTGAGLRRVMDFTAVVAPTDATVLITGETGTGKERIARFVHELSSRKERSFIKLNCAAIPTGLLESELFGHEKGAFTGAVSQKIGRLELADKGTLFLDEIGDIPLELQPKLLRVLQDYEFERLGGTRTIRVNVRLIAATNRDLEDAVKQKQFRQDLFYRLHVFPIHVPALRERKSDIPLLVRYFVEKSAAQLKKRIEIIPDDVIDAMTSWHWPGNVRELEHFVERSVILSPSRILAAPLDELVSTFDEKADETLRGQERAHIIHVLRQTRGVLSGPDGAAERLGLKRTTLQYRMQKLGISRLEFLD